MAEVKWSEEQKQAIYEEGSNILVAAAAGSGKTAVLVERIINKIINKKIDIDKMLVVTFTNAAAAEMKERILEAIYKKLDENPEDEHLQKQIMLLSKASICTIDSFCLDVIKNNFYEMDITPNFRIADSAEIELIKQEVLEDLFEKKYIEKDQDFLDLINIYTGYRGDEPLKELVLKIYEYIQSSPYPEEWLEENIEKFNVKKAIDENEDFVNSEWGKILIENIRGILKDCIYGTKNIQNSLNKYPELEKYYRTISNDLDKYEELNKGLDSWDLGFEIVQGFKLDTWPSDRKLVSNAKDDAKAKRDFIKKKFEVIQKKLMIYSSKEAYEDIYAMYPILSKLKNLILEFSDEFAKRKKTKNIIDFNDMEHFALKLLTKKDENGNHVGTEVAEKYKEKFEEIAIDEYQDSNLVQEQILTTISKGNNIFMVGDVKQSIYKFRQACPNLFLNKYENYDLKKNFNDQSTGLKIQLFKNFRSRINVLDITNLVFQNIMSKKLGDIEYENDEYLNLGASYEEPKDDLKTQFHIIDLKQNEEDELETETENENEIENDIESNSTNEEDELDRIENTELEAKFVASEIKKLLNSDHVVWDRKKECYRKVRPKDIAILLRSTSALAPSYEKELSELDIPVFSDVSQEYLDSVEIQVMMSVLKIIDNPMQDIPLITVLRSIIGDFSDNELVSIRLVEKKTSFYESMEKYIEEKIDSTDTEEINLRNKVIGFIQTINKWREAQEYLPLDELLWKIYIESGYYNYVSLLPNGKVRQANLKMLFERAKQYEKASFRGLFNFNNFIEKIKTGSGDLSSAKLISENDDVVRIMSIHKSKGLEFPIVFLSGTGKGINLKDLNNNILLHQDLGLGPKYENYERKIEYNTLAKEAIRCVARRESLSEEMRVLYVALTRAKEQLIITGYSKEVEKALKEKEEILNSYSKNKNNKIDSNIIQKYTSYLNWLELIYLYNKDDEEHNDKMQLIIHKKADIVKQIKENREENEESYDLEKDILKKKEENTKLSEEKINEIRNILNWNYQYSESVTIPTKTSVSLIKEKKIENNIKEIKLEIEQIKENNIEEAQTEEVQTIKLQDVPEFIEKKQGISAAQRGTLMHLCLQMLDEKKDYTINDIKDFINDLVLSNRISQEEADVIDVYKIYNFTQSQIAKELKNAKIVYKEQPFYINVLANEIYDVKNNEDKVLVQGIIDLYYVDENDKIVLVDYKTDRVNYEQELIDKYKVQLDLYKRAIEKSTKRKVDRVFIYSTSLNKEISVEM